MAHINTNGRYLKALELKDLFLRDWIWLMAAYILDVYKRQDLLRQSQNGHYTPFVSAELNKAMRMMLDSSTGDVYKRQD